MIEVVDRTESHEVQKITKKNGKLVRYQVVELPSGNHEKVSVFCTLTDARCAIGKSANGKLIPQPVA